MVTTDHISPAGNIQKESPTGEYFMEHQILPKDYNSYGSRRGNHEVMMRGTFANIRIRNEMAPETEGGFTTIYPEAIPENVPFTKATTLSPGLTADITASSPLQPVPATPKV